MAKNNLSEGVGKKIVEALKKQSEIEINPTNAQEQIQNDIKDFIGEDFATETLLENDDDRMDILDELVKDSEEKEMQDVQSIEPVENVLMFDDIMSEKPASAPAFEEVVPRVQPRQISYQTTMPKESLNDLDGFEMPGNVAVLKKLISQLPTGVTRHTGALIIKQTMEALGISMKSVLQEAQQVQDSLSNSANECQASIQEYKKQIAILEKQAQNNQRQYSALNELISLFIQS